MIYSDRAVKMSFFRISLGNESPGCSGCWSWRSKRAPRTPHRLASGCDNTVLCLECLRWSRSAILIAFDRGLHRCLWCVKQMSRTHPVRRRTARCKRRERWCWKSTLDAWAFLRGCRWRRWRIRKAPRSAIRDARPSARSCRPAHALLLAWSRAARTLLGMRLRESVLKSHYRPVMAKQELIQTWMKTCSIHVQHSKFNT